MVDIPEADASKVMVDDTRPSLVGTHCDLRPFYAADEAAVQQICSDKEIARNTLSIPHPYPPAQASHWIKQHVQLWKSGEAAIFAICLKGQGALVGAIGLEINEQDQNAELGYWIARDHWGQGFATAAGALVIRFGFEKLALNKIHARVFADNNASIRVLEKLGMEKEGYLKKHLRKWGQFRDVIWYGKLAPPILSDFNDPQSRSES